MLKWEAEGVKVLVNRHNGGEIVVGLVGGSGEAGLDEFAGYGNGM